MTRKVLILILVAGAGVALALGVLAGGPAGTSAGDPALAAREELGKQLYFDPRLSKSGTVSCNSCHNVMAGGDDNRPVSVGVDGKVGGRSAPTVWNATLLSVQFWDGRAATLEDQAKGPLVNPVEMAMGSHDLVVRRIADIPDYRQAFERAFPGEASPLTIDNVARAVASYERTLIAMNSPYDKFVAGDSSALGPAARRGYQVALSTGCVTCHSGRNFAGPELEKGQGFYMKFPGNPGLAYDAEYRLTEDAGRYGVTKDEADRNVWRVPTLRNVALTAPYFHNGSVPTLDEAVRVMAKTQMGRDLTDAEAADVVEFLKSLTGEFPAQTMPRLPATPARTVIQP